MKEGFSLSSLHQEDNKGYHTDEQNDYCRPVSEIDSANAYSDIFISEEEPRDSDFRYHIVNLTHFNEDIELMEVRMQQGTVMYQKIIPWICLWMQIFNSSRFQWQGPGFVGEVFEGGNVKISKYASEWEDIFWLLEKEDIKLSPRHRDMLYRRRKELSEYWEEVLPKRVTSWRKHGWYD